MTDGLFDTSVFCAEAGDCEMYESDHSTEGGGSAPEGGEAESKSSTAAPRRARVVASGLEVWREA